MAGGGESRVYPGRLLNLLLLATEPQAQLWRERSMHRHKPFCNRVLRTR